jgi:hypothetical protein
LVSVRAGAHRRHRRHARQRIVPRVLVTLIVVIGAGALYLFVVRGRSAAAIAKADIARAAAISPLRGRIVAVAESQVGYRTDPANTYCNKYSAYWASGTNDCGNGNLAEQWCADFAAWVWQQAGANVNYQYVNGDLNSSSASFYEWGVAHGTWHPVGSRYVPRPGDVAVYGLDVANLVAQHDAIVVSYTNGDRGPDAVNGDGNHTGFSVVEISNNEYQADISAKNVARVAGYVSPS